MYIVEARVRYLPLSEDGGQEAPLRSGIKATFWLDEMGTYCEVRFLDVGSLAPGQSARCAVVLPLAEQSLKSLPQPGSQFVIGHIQNQPVLVGVVESVAD